MCRGQEHCAWECGECQVAFLRELADEPAFAASASASERTYSAVALACVAAGVGKS